MARWMPSTKNRVRCSLPYLEIASPQDDGYERKQGDQWPVQLKLPNLHLTFGFEIYWPRLKCWISMSNNGERNKLPSAA